MVVPDGTAPPRPDVLGYPSPTTSRYLVLAAALLASGLFVGNFVHTWLLGDEWQQRVAVCQGRYGGGGTELAEMLSTNARFHECTAGVERRRTAVTVGGAAVEAGAALAMLWLAPVVVRRRRRLRDLPDGLSGAARRFDELAVEAGVQGRVAPLLGSSTQRDAFSFGAPGRYRVALPPAAAVRWRDASTFDPLVSHELAHVAHRDVALAWLTRLVWLALAPLLALPLVVGAVTGDTSILGAYWWRTALLAAAVTLLSSDLLRSREHGADLRAARLRGGPAQVADLVRRTTGRVAAYPRRLLAKHPTSEQRVAVLERPGLLTRTGFADGLTGAFLAALAVPLLVSTISPLTPSGRAGLSYVGAAVLVGPVLAGAVGLGLWRAALFARLSGDSVPLLGPAAGVGLGFVLGQSVSLQQAGLGSLTGRGAPAWVLVSGLAGAGATVLASGLGHLWADAAPRLPGVRAAWWLALALTSVVFASVLWATTLFQAAVDLGGWQMGRAVVGDGPLSSWTMWWLVVLLALAALGALVARPRGATVPGWLLEHLPGAASGGRWPDGPSSWRQAVGAGALAGAAGVAVVVTYSLAAGPVSGLAAFDRVLAYEWVAAAVSAAAAVALVAVHSNRGAGTALLAGPVAALVVLAGYGVLNVARGGTTDLAVVTAFVRPAVVTGYYATLVLVPVGALVAAAPHRHRRPVVALVAAGVLAALLGTAALAGRAGLVADVDALTERSLAGATVQQGAVSRAALVTELTTYLQEVVAPTTSRYDALTVRAQQIWGDPSLDAPTRVDLTRRDVLPALHDLADDAATYPTGAAEVTRLHTELLDALRMSLTRYDALVATGGDPTPADVDRLSALREQEDAHWREWAAQREALAASLLAG